MSTCMHISYLHHAKSSEYQTSIGNINVQVFIIFMLSWTCRCTCITWFFLTSKDVEKCVDQECMEIPLLVWVGINGGLVFVAAVLTACFEVKSLTIYDNIRKKYKTFGLLLIFILVYVLFKIVGILYCNPTDWPSVCILFGFPFNHVP